MKCIAMKPCLPVSLWLAMKPRMTVLIISALLFGSVTRAGAQRHAHDSRGYFDYGDPMMTSVIQSADGKTADVRVNTASAMFSFQRAKNSPRGAYFAIRDVTIEVSEDGSTQPLMTRTRLDTIFVATFELSTAKDDWHALSENINLPTLDTGKQYSLRIEVRDGIDRLVMRPVVTPLRRTVCSLKADSCGIAFGDIMLIDSLKDGMAYMGGRGNTYMFSRDVIGAITFKLTDSLTTNPNVDVRVRQITNLFDPADTGDRGLKALSSSDLNTGMEFAFQRADHILSYTLAPTSDKSTWTAIFTVPGATFEQGKYVFFVRVKAGSFERTQKNEFQIIWQNQPLTLGDPIAAIQPMQHILSPDEYSTMNSGSRQEMFKKLFAYWRTKDPTPGTAYNERMAAFYARVDYADFNFANTHLLDGVMTDRGKVYLLYGPPTKTDRSFLPGESPVETWTYTNNVKRVFRFESHSHGEYKLTDVKTLATTN